MTVVQARHTVDAYRLFILQAEELNLLSVQSAVHLGARPGLLLQVEPLAEVLQSQVNGEIGPGGTRPLTQRAFPKPGRPALLEAALTQAVATRQDNGVSEDVVAHWAGDLFHRHGEVSCHPLLLFHLVQITDLLSPGHC